MTVPVTQQRFFDAAMQVLADDGVGALKLALLCRRVGVTTGAFYHAFGSWNDFTEQLLSHWVDERTTRVEEAAAAAAGEPTELVDWLLQVALELPHASESAIRTWAGVDPGVGRLQAEVDRIRLDVVTQAFLGVTGDKESAARLARAALYVVIGYEQAGEARDREAFEAALRLLPLEAKRLAGG